MSNSQEYYQIFINQFIQTLAQLSAVIISGSLAVPVYSYYVKGRAVQQRDSSRYSENQFLNVNKSTENENDSDSENDSNSETTSENSSIIIGNEPPTFIEKQEFKDDSTSTF